MLLALQIDCYLGDVWCEWGDLTHRGVDSGVLSRVCFAHTNCHPDKCDTLPSLISACPDSACSSKFSLNSPSFSKPFLTPIPSLHSLVPYICLACHDHCHPYFIRINVGNLFVLPDHIWDPSGQTACQMLLSLSSKYRIQSVIHSGHLTVSCWINSDKLNGQGTSGFGILVEFLV